MADNVQTSSDRLRWAALVVDYLARPLIAAELSRLRSAFPFGEPATRDGQPNGTRSNRCRCGAVPVHSGRHMRCDRRARNGLPKACQPRKELVGQLPAKEKRGRRCRPYWSAQCAASSSLAALLGVHSLVWDEARCNCSATTPIPTAATLGSSSGR